MFVSSLQLSKSLENLGHIHPFFGFAFFAFKGARLPIGSPVELNFTRAAGSILDKYYRPFDRFEAYYTPFKTSDKSKRWLTKRYASTSLQRITSDTFSDALLHIKGSSLWGWSEDYLKALSAHLGGHKIPAFDLALWMYRDRDWPESINPNSILEYLFDDNGVTASEIDMLFDTRQPFLARGAFLNRKILDRELAELIGYPRDVVPDEGAAVRYFDAKFVGPAGEKFRYEPSDRLNIITGDNGVGKTFIFEILWWALTGRWNRDYDPVPWSSVPSSSPQISFGLAALNAQSVDYVCPYDWKTRSWTMPIKRQSSPGLVIYARYDGSYAFCDPHRIQQIKNDDSNSVVFLNRDQLWNGLSTNQSGSQKSICNGLIDDWVNWQTRNNLYHGEYDMFISCLRKCSASRTLDGADSEILEPGLPVRPSQESRFFPTLKLPYGEVIVTQVSAGVRRIISLAYAIVWSWFEHLRNSELVNKTPQRRIILMVDEVEAHLHPNWQRVIVPAIIEIVKSLSKEALPQLHIATHSPLVLASVEPLFDETRDDIHHLLVDHQSVVLEELPFVKRGSVDLWLMSRVFGLDYARSVEASQSLKKAKDIQISGRASLEELVSINQSLERYLAPDDEFWPTWRFYMRKSGLG